MLNLKFTCLKHQVVNEYFFLNASFCRYGLNIVSADALIILNNILNYKQLIWRAYRYPCVCPLYIYKFSEELSDHDDGEDQYTKYDNYKTFSKIVKDLNDCNNEDDDNNNNDNNNDNNVNNNENKKNDNKNDNNN